MSVTENETEGVAEARSNLLTVSRVAAYQLCPRLHDLQYHQGYRPIVEDENQHFGHLWHACMEAGLLAAMRQQRAVGGGVFDATTEFVTAACAMVPGEDEMDPYERQRVLAHLLGVYHVFVREEFFDKHEILAVEEPFLFRHMNPATNGISPIWLRAGRVDAIVRHRATGRIRVVEHKTTSDDIAPDSVYWTKLVMDAQISQYILGVESMHPDLRVDECVYSALHKTGMRPLKATPPEARKYTQPKFKQCPECRRLSKASDYALVLPHAVMVAEGVYENCEPDPEGGPRRVCTDRGGVLYAQMRDRDETPEEYGKRMLAEISENLDAYYRLQVVPRTDEQILDSLRNMWAVSQAIREDRKNGWAPKNPRACHHFGTCSFWGVCTGTERLDNQDKFQRLANVHPELGDDFVTEVVEIRATHINTKQKEQ